MPSAGRRCPASTPRVAPRGTGSRSDSDTRSRRAWPGTTRRTVPQNRPHDKPAGTPRPPDRGSTRRGRPRRCRSPGATEARPRRPRRPGHPDRVPAQPAVPDLGDEGSGGMVERVTDRAVGVGRVARRVAVRLEQRFVARTREGRAASEVRPPALERPVVPVAQEPGPPREHRAVAGLEQGIPCVRRESAEQVRPEHRRDHRPVAATRLPGDPPVIALGQGPVATVDERHDLLAQVGVVATGGRRVEVLTATVGRPAVDEHHDGRGRRTLARPLTGEQRIDVLRGGRSERRPVPPHVDLAGHPLDEVDRRIAPGRSVVVTRRDVHPDRPLRRVAERVADERRAVDRELIETTVERPGPGTHVHLLRTTPGSL